MLNEAQTSATMRKIASAFLADQRTDGNFVGWGQFVGPDAGMQVGLYGICAGIIAIAIALPNSPIPQQVISTVESIWAERNTPNSKGARYFALTVRLAFLLLALRVSKNPRLQLMVNGVQKELQARLAPDGLLYGWYIDPTSNSAAGDEYTSAITLLAYGLSTSFGPTPTFIEGVSKTLLGRLYGAHSPSLAFRRLYLSAIAMTLPRYDLSRVKGMVRSEFRNRHDSGANYLYFWDYKYRGSASAVFQRDYFYIPPDVVEVFLSSNTVSGTMQRLAAIDTLQIYWSQIEPTPNGLFYRQGTQLAASKDQAWISLALSLAGELLKSDKPISRIWMRLVTGTTDNWFFNFILPLLLLMILAALSVVPDIFLNVPEHYGYLKPKPNWWDDMAKPALMIVGVALLTVRGQTLWDRMISFVKSRLP